MSTTVLNELKPAGYTPIAHNRVEVTARPQRTIISRRRRARINWEAISVILLMLASAAVGLYRLVWMGQM